MLRGCLALPDGRASDSKWFAMEERRARGTFVARITVAPKMGQLEMAEVIAEMRPRVPDTSGTLSLNTID